MMTSRTSKFLLATSAFAALALASHAASAAGFANRQQSATGMGFAYAGAGTSAWGLGSMFWNPANITNFEGRNSEWNLSLIVPSSSVTTDRLVAGPGGALNLLPLTGGNVPSGNINQGVVAPASYNSYQVNNWLWLGLASGSPFGSSTKADANFAGKVYGNSTKIKALAVTPTVGIKLNEQVSFGFGVTIQEFKGEFKGGDIRLVGVDARLGPNILKGDDYGFGFTAGLTLKPVQGTEITLGFRSMIHHDLKGSFTTLAGITPIKLKVNTPEIVTLGLRQQINQQWAVVGTAQWTNWSRIKVPAFLNTNTGAPISRLGIGYKDEYFVALGAEYQHSPAWKFRAGVAYEKAPTDDENRGVRVLDGNRIITSVGAGYKWNEKVQVDFSYSHLFIKSGLVNIVPGHVNFAGVTYFGRSRAHADNIAISLKYRWDDPAPSAAPIVKKF